MSRVTTLLDLLEAYEPSPGEAESGAAVDDNDTDLGDAELGDAELGDGKELP